MYNSFSTQINRTVQDVLNVQYLSW